MAYGETFDTDRTGNYLADHWYGRLPLGQSYWINGGMIGAIVATMGPGVFRSLTEQQFSLRRESLLIITGIALGLAVWIWGAVGIWRSSARHHARGGQPVWAAAARAMVLAGLVGNLLNLPEMVLFLGESGRLAAGVDPLGQPIAVRTEGTVLHLDGAFALGSADKVRAALDQAPAVRTVYLASIGGRLGEADQIGAMIKARKLDTVASGACLSACTLAFVAGVHRSLLLNGHLGFHQPRFPGLGPAELDQMSKIQRRALADAGIPGWFIERSLQAPPESMWMPGEADLFNAGVLNSMTRERVIEDNALTARQMKLKLPRQLDAVTTLSAITADGTTLRNRVTLAADAAMVDKARLRNLIIGKQTATVCTSPIGRLMVLAGAVYTEDVVDRHGRLLASASLNHCAGAQ